MPNPSQRPCIGVAILAEASLTILGLKEALANRPGIFLSAESSCRDDIERFCASLTSDVIVVSLSQKDDRLRVAAALGQRPEIAVVLLASDLDDFEICEFLRSPSFAACPQSVDSDQLYLAVNSVFHGFTCLGPDAHSVVANLTTSAINSKKQCSSARVSCALTDRETEVLKLIATGLTNPQIAQRLVISQATVKAHVRGILFKLGVPDRTTAAVEAVRLGLLPAQSVRTRNDERSLLESTMNLRA